MRTRPRGGYRIARLLTQALLMVVAYIGFIVYTTPIVAAQSSTTGACIKAASTYDNCTANDTGFGAFTVINVTDGCTSPSDTFTAEIKAEVISTGQTKYDVGMWINLDGTDAINGNSCYRQILSPGVASPYPGLNLTGGNGPFRIEDGDSCGDIRQNESTVALIPKAAMMVVSNTAVMMLTPGVCCAVALGTMDLSVCARRTVVGMMWRLASTISGFVLPRKENQFSIA